MSLHRKTPNTSASRRWDWLLLLLATTWILSIGGTLSLLSEIGTPFGGFIAYRSIFLNRWQVDVNTPTWWAAMSSNDLDNQQDTLVSLNQEPFGPNQDQIYAAAGIGREVTLEISRDGRLRTAVLTLIPFSPAQFLDLKTPELISGAAFLLLALLVFSAAPDNPISRGFVLVSTVAAGYRTLVLTTLFIDANWYGKLFELCLISYAGFLGPAIFYFALLFPRPTPLVNTPALQRAIAGVGGITAASFILSRLLWWGGGPLVWAQRADMVGFYLSLLGLGGGALTLLLRPISLLLFGRPSRRERRQLTAVIAGFSCALPLILATIAPLTGVFSDGYRFFWSGLDLRYLLLFVPLVFAYLILRYQTFRTSHPLFLGVLVMVASALLASIGSWLWQKAQPAAWADYTIPPFTILFLLLCGSGLFWSMQTSWNGALNRLWHWETRSYRSSKRFGERLAAGQERQGLPQAVAAALVDEIELEHAAIWLWDAGTEQYQLAGQAGEQQPELPTTLKLPPFDTIAPQFIPDLRRRADTAAALTIQSFVIFIPLAISGQPVGLLATGMRWDEEIFDGRDREILELIGQQTALLLLVNRQMETLRQVPGMVIEAQEQERMRLAQELHDTVQQFLGRLPFYLELIRTNITTEPEEAARLVEQSIADVGEAARTLRHIRSNLAPLQLENGLLPPLHKLLRQWSQRTGLPLHSNLPDKEPSLSLEQRHAIYRVTQQALDNVEAHAGATAVRFTLALETEQISIQIADNGRGMDPVELQTAQQGPGFGLTSMRARIEALDGTFQIMSGLRKGTTVNGKLPLDV